MPEPPDDDPQPADLRRLQSGNGLDLAALFAMWQGRNLDQWSHSPQGYELLGNRLLSVGEPLMAYDVTNEGLQYWPLDIRLRQLEALALARSGATQPAQDILRSLYDAGHTDEETLGLLARTYKDLYFATKAPGARLIALRSAADLYAEAYQRHGGYWSGVNAATLGMLLGERERALSIARAVREECLQLLDKLPDGEDPYWLVATLGEANIVLEEWAQAEQWYIRAAEHGRQRLGDLVSTRHNARLLLAHMDGDHEAIQRALHVPSVVVFTGHLVDHPDRGVPRFPRHLERVVSEAIRDRLVRDDCLIGYASAGPGADILFLEALLDLGGEANVVLPYDRDEFLRNSAKFVGDPSWTERSERVLKRATRVIVASPQRTVSGPTTFEFANLMLHGLASNRAEHLETSLVRLAVWDGKPGDGPGGTASAVQQWQQLGHPVQIVTLPTLMDTPTTGVRGGQFDSTQPNSESSAPVAKDGFQGEIVAMLFGDAVHFSMLDEDGVVRFGRHFLGAIGHLIATSPHAPLMKNTWGDGLFFVFSSVRHAGMFALALRDLVNGTNWASNGLPVGLNLRIGLHAGCVFSYTDPITERPNYLGTQVSRAARIEPVTPPGHVYASEAFAALTSAEGITEFTCDYVGQTPLAKGYGTFPTYHVRPT
jgi:class 3 adenylate cyclase